jgi:hypothetical protein
MATLDISNGGDTRFCLMKTMTRRKFLKTGVRLAAVASGLEVIGGCATSETPKVKTLVYSPLPYNKIQPLQEGCFVGFFKEPEAYARLKDSRFIPQHSPEIEAARKAKNIDEYIVYRNAQERKLLRKDEKIPNR